MLLLLVLVATTTCNVVPLGDGERRTRVAELAGDVMVPTLDEAAVRTGALAAALADLAAAPAQPALDRARAAWRAARVPWKQSEAFAFGPAMDERLAAAIDQVVEPARIDDELAGTAALTPAYVANLGANKKGFHTVEYLVFGDDATILAALAGEPRRRDYVTSLGVALAADMQRLAQLWSEDYVAVLTLPGAGNATFPTIKTVVDTVVNESVFLAELIADSRIGKPLGNASGGTPQPALEESGPSDNSLADMTASLQGIQAVYRGTRDGGGEAGVRALIASRSPALDREVELALSNALAAIAAVPRPFRTAIVTARAEVEAAYAAVKELKTLLGTEVVATLGATLQFNDNDGD
ncbi:MAG: imelysin family protein [Kofleriaceae bacterium]